MKAKVYIETTVISYLAAKPSTNTIIAGRQVLTQEWWEQCRSSFKLVVSELVFQEAEAGDAEAAKQRAGYIAEIVSLTISDEAVVLAEALVSKGPIPKEYGDNPNTLSSPGCDCLGFFPRPPQMVQRDLLCPHRCGDPAKRSPLGSVG